MPYIVTTCGHLSDGRLHQWGDPTAVATLDEANRIAYEHQRSADASIGRFNAQTVTEAGGTIGPLPDGTVIEVRPIAWCDLAREADESMEARHVEGNWPAEHLRVHRRRVLDAFNSDEVLA